jgi:RNA polymerase sigma-70 factor, ECF subfamily
VDEREAIRRCLSGDKDAFATLVRQYQAQILALCLRMTGNREDAADAAQQAFVNSYRHLDRYDLDQPFRPWLFRIATNECIALLRRRGRRAAEIPGDQALEAVADPEEGAPALVDLADDRERVRRAVADLPDQYRTVVLLYYFQEFSYQEVARQTGLSVGTISTHLHRAKQLLRRLLTSEEVGTGDARHTREPAAIPGR